VITLKKPEDETERLARVTGIQWHRNGLRHSFCSYRVAITGDIPLVAMESGSNGIVVVDIRLAQCMNINRAVRDLCNRRGLDHIRLDLRPTLNVNTKAEDPPRSSALAIDEIWLKITRRETRNRSPRQVDRSKEGMLRAFSYHPGNRGRESNGFGCRFTHSSSSLYSSFR